MWQISHKQQRFNIIITEDILPEFFVFTRNFKRVTPVLLDKLKFNDDINFKTKSHVSLFIKEQLNYNKKNAQSIDILKLLGNTEVELQEIKDEARSSRKKWKDGLTEEEIAIKIRTNSVLCKEYWLTRGYSEEETLIKISEYQIKNSKKSKEKYTSDERKTFSPRCIEYWLIKGYSEEDALEAVKDFQKKSSKRCVEYWINNGYSEEDAKAEVSKHQKENWKHKGPLLSIQNTKHVDYWTAKGYSLIEAKEIISKAAATFSLETCKEKYGEELGFIKWQERQDKWQNTLKSKTEEELFDINQRKVSILSTQYLWDKSFDIPGKFYIIRLNETYTKIGITSKEIYQRYKHTVLDECLSIEIFDNETINESFMIEQLLRKQLNVNSITAEDYKTINNAFGVTEVFKNCYDEIKELSNIYLQDSILLESDFNELRKHQNV
jgi:hypothetical protein